MDDVLNSLLVESQINQMQNIIIKNGPYNEKYLHFQTQFNQLQKCQMFTEIQGESFEFRQTNHKTHQKSPLIPQKNTKEEYVKQLPSLTQQIHSKFIEQKQKELIKFLTISFTILVFIVLILEYYLQKKRI